MRRLVGRADFWLKLMSKNNLQNVKRYSAIFTSVIILAIFFFGENDYTVGLTFGMRFVAFAILVVICAIGIILTFKLPKN